MTSRGSKFSIRLHVKGTEKISLNTKIVYSTNTVEHPSLQNLSLNNTTVVELITIIKEDTIPSAYFQRKFPGYLFLNESIGLKKWKRNADGKIIKGKTYDVRTEEDASGLRDEVAIQNEWINHVKEHGEKVGRNEFIIDVAVVIYRKNNPPQRASASASGEITGSTITNTHNNVTIATIQTNADDVSSITSVTTSSKNKKRRKNHRFIAPKTLRVHVVHPVTYNTQKGSYESHYPNGIDTFDIEMGDEFIAYRYQEDDTELDGAEDDLPDNLIRMISDANEDKFKNNIIQPLKHQLGYFIMNNEKVKKFYDGKIGTKSALFIAVKNARKVMMKIKRSEDVEKFIRENATDDKRKKWDDGMTTMSIKLGFGVVLEGDEIVGPDYFINEPLGQDKLIMSAESVNEPSEKFDKKKEQLATKNNATMMESYLNKCYNTEESPFYHGFTQEMKMSFFSATVYRSEKMKQIVSMEDKNTFSLPTELSNHFKSSLLRNQTQSQLGGLAVEKNKYPPIDNMIPTINQWLRTEAGREHETSRGRNNRNNNNNDLAESIRVLVQARAAEAIAQPPPVPAANVAVVASPSMKFEKGTIRVFTREGMDPADKHFGKNREFQSDTKVYDVLRKVGPHVPYDKDTEERIFKVDTKSGTQLDFTVDDMKQEDIDSLCTLALGEPEKWGSVLNIYSRKRNKTIEMGENAEGGYLTE